MKRDEIVARRAALIATLLAVLLFMMSHVDAQEAASAQDVLPSPGVTPDSLFYFFDKLFEKIEVSISKDKSVVHVKIAMERIAEAREMATRNKARYVDVAMRGHDEEISEVDYEQGDARARETYRSALLAKDALLRHEVALNRLRELLASERMPEASKAGLQNALESSGRFVESKRSSFEMEVKFASASLPESERNALACEVEVEVKHKIKINDDKVEEEFKMEIEEECDEAELEEVEEESEEESDDERTSARGGGGGASETSVVSALAEKECSDVISAQVVSRWKTHRGEVVEAGNNCIAKEYSKAGWELVKEQ